ncbi:cytochrome P450 [Auriscalpium vulgare]|uniref:Cytochrome P450 n=1 Tax=Auriscalpium vulgare TaxID=40419 RepID=A0ACB8SAF4_9AGAM|nr:cytochrome P450 [Auriscalpium vulgare]
MELPYLDAVCRETLRLFPPLELVARLPKGRHHPSLHPRPKRQRSADLALHPARHDGINIKGINRDADLWGADAAEWNPERWLSPPPVSLLKAQIPGIYSHTMTFLGGGRSCIGFKFSQLEMKVVLSQLVHVFRFSQSKEREVLWRFGGISTPTVKGSHDAAEAKLPVIVERFVQRCEV